MSTNQQQHRVPHISPLRCGLVAATILALAATHAPAQWELLPSPTTSGLRGIHALGNGIAWASGTDGTVLRTTDDGAHWQLCPTPPAAEHLDFRGIQAFDAQTAIVMSSGKGELSRLYKTTDGCGTWKLVFTNPDKEGFWDAISMSAVPDNKLVEPFYYSHALGFVLGDPIAGTFSLFSTNDGGETWKRRTSTKRGPKGEGCKTDSFHAADKESSFAASNESMLGYAPFFLFVTGGSTARLAYTDQHSLDGAFCHDAAAFIDLPLVHGNASSGAFAIAAIDQQSFFPLKLMVVGGDYKLSDHTSGSSVFVSSKDGLHVPFTSYFDLTIPQTPPHGYRSAVAYSPATKTWITVGPNGTDISTDDGRNWRALKPNPASGEDRDWNALSLPFVVGPKGRIGRLRPNALAPPAMAKP